MTVKELKEALEGFADNMPVVLLSDEEGNRCSELGPVLCVGRWDRLSGNYYSEPDEDTDEEDMPPKRAKECIVLFPE